MGQSEKKQQIGKIYKEFKVELLKLKKEQRKILKKYSNFLEKKKLDLIRKEMGL
jgi:hypothetical protein